MSRFQIKKFCFCCSLKTGAITIAIFDVVGSIFLAIPRPGSFSHLSNKTEDSKKLEIVLFIANICAAAIGLVLNSLLLYGISKNSRKFLLPWLILKFIGLIMMFVLSFVMIIVFQVYGVIFGIIFLIVTIYGVHCWMCVWSLYMQMGVVDRPLDTQFAGESLKMDVPKTV